MGEAIDDMRNMLPQVQNLWYGSDVAVSKQMVATAIDEYDAAAATAGRLMAENAGLERAVRCLGNLVAETVAACAVWRKRAEAAEESLRFAYATKTDVPSETESVCSVPGNAWDVIVRDRDEWRKRAEAAEAKLANLRPHPEDEADCAEGMRQAEAGEGVSGDVALEQLKWMIENCEEP